MEKFKMKSIWRSLKCKVYIYIKNKLYKSLENFLRLFKFKFS